MDQISWALNVLYLALELKLLGLSLDGASSVGDMELG
jgi:hypothetical protein